jgi:hypothetical protein
MVERTVARLEARAADAEKRLTALEDRIGQGTDPSKDPNRMYEDMTFEGVFVPKMCSACAPL